MLTAHAPQLRGQRRHYREWTELGPDDAIAAIAPLFHITGLAGHVALSLLVLAPLVLWHRFHPGAMVDAIRKHRSVFTVGAITAFAAFAVAPGVAGCRLRQLRRAPRQDLFQRAPIAPA